MVSNAWEKLEFMAFSGSHGACQQWRNPDSSVGQWRPRLTTFRVCLLLPLSLVQAADLFYLAGP